MPNMSKPVIWFLIVFFLTAGGAARPGAAKTAAQEVKNGADNAVEVLEEKLLLETDLELAKSSRLYIILDLRNNKILLKLRGIVLREWMVEIARFWGNAIPIKALILEKKSAFFSPKRENIKPGQNKENKKNELRILEVTDMPSMYNLYFAGGIKMHIRPQTRGFFASFFNLGRSIRWYTVPPLITLWYSLSRKPFTAVDLVMKDKQEVRSLYWTFIEGTPCIIFPPKNLSLPPQMEPRPDTPGKGKSPAESKIKQK
jgi:hypothetical protein